MCKLGILLLKYPNKNIFKETDNTGHDFQYVRSALDRENVNFTHMTSRKMDEYDMKKDEWRLKIELDINESEVLDE